MAKTAFKGTPVTSQRTEIVLVGMDDNNIGLLCLGKTSGNDNR